MEKLKPASKSTQESYDPQGSGMDHSRVFAKFAPGSANSGNMAHKHGADGDHSVAVAPPTGMKGD